MEKLGFENIELIRKALNDELSETDAAEFNRRLQESDSFAKQYEMLRQLRLGNREKEKKRIRAFLAERDKSNKRSIRRFLPIAYKVAAGIILLIGVYLIFPFGANSNKVTAAEERSQILFLKENSDNTASIGQGLNDLFAKEQFEKAFETLKNKCGEAVCESQVDAYYYGRLLLYLKKDYDQAIVQFKYLEGDEFALDRYPNVPLYLARAYMAKGEMGMAYQLIEPGTTLKELKRRIQDTGGK